MLAFERTFWREHPVSVLAGMDEAGRGPLAGPVFAAAVTMAPEVAEAAYAGPLAELTDSKQLLPTQRETFFSYLHAHPGVQIGLGQASVAEIDDLNILCATHLAMRRALLALPGLPHHVLVDGLPVKGLPCDSTAIVQGDGRSFLIAAASVVAKVLRDRHMLELHGRYPVYGFNENKGYGTHGHILALLRHEPCPEHRRSFRPVQDTLEFLPGFQEAGLEER